MNWQQRIENYGRVTGFPRSLFIAEDGRIVGTWIMGNDYRVKSEYYGGYPAGYLRRIGALFPDRRKVLHIFSGKVELSAMPGDTVDVNPDLEPTFVADAHDLSSVPLHDYDLILADPPYSVEDAVRYQTTMVKRNVVLRTLAAGVAEGTRLVWLDQVLPMYRKEEWDIEAAIGMYKSTNHRFRGITIFKRRAKSATVTDGSSSQNIRKPRSKPSERQPAIAR
jgi:16S rRNA G966 N2-methylase RsmD